MTKSPVKAANVCVDIHRTVPINFLDNVHCLDVVYWRGNERSARLMGAKILDILLNYTQMDGCME